MLEKFVSRKLFMALITDIVALVLAFGGKLSPEQAAAIVAISNTVYLLANAIAAKKS
jgi:cation transport ATPase